MKEWTVTRGSDIDQTAITEAISHFFSKANQNGNIWAFYAFLLRFIGCEQIQDDYGRLFFREKTMGLELQKFEGSQGFHDDKCTCRTVHIYLATEDRRPVLTCENIMDENAEWNDLATMQDDYRRKRLDGCGSVEVTFRKETRMGSFYTKEIVPTYFVKDVPGLNGTFLIRYIYDRN